MLFSIYVCMYVYEKKRIVSEMHAYNMLIGAQQFISMAKADRDTKTLLFFSQEWKTLNGPVKRFYCKQFSLPSNLFWIFSFCFFAQKFKKKKILSKVLIMNWQWMICWYCRSHLNCMLPVIHKFGFRFIFLFKKKTKIKSKNV